MANVVLSRNGAGALIAALVALVLAAGGCATSKEEQVRKIQARNAYDQGGSNFREGRVSLGLAALQEAVQLDPENAVYHNALGVAQLQLRRWPEAQASFEKAIELDPGYAEAYHNLGLALARQGRLDQAIASYRKALTFPTYPSPELAYHNMGEAYLGRGSSAKRRSPSARRSSSRRRTSFLIICWELSWPRLAGRTRPRMCSARPGTSIPAPPSGS